jgi:small subunit ribosomal protein S5
LSTNYQAQGTNQDSDRIDSSLKEKVVKIRRVSKVVKGGRHMSFNALVVVGDGAGQVGVGLGKAISVPDAVRKGRAIAQKKMFHVILQGTTIPHKIIGKHGAAHVLLRPAPPGTGIIAGASARAVLEQAGAKDVVTKSLRSQNPINVVHATLNALLELRNPSEEEARRKNSSANDSQETTAA